MMSILMTAFGIGFLILAHEFGHFIVAKLGGVKVERFSIGFGPEIVGVTIGETRYSLRVLPLGGYVKMLGDEPGSEEAQSQRGFLGQRFSKKMAIVVAGAVMNIILSLVLFIAVFRIGVALPAARIGDVMYGMPAYYAGLKTGDRILRVGNRSEVDFTDFRIAVALASPGEAVDIVVERDARTFDMRLYPVIAAEGLAAVGVTPYATLKVEALVPPQAGDDKAPRSPARAGGLEPGYIITAFNGEAVESWYELERRILENGLAPHTLTASRDGVEKTFDITPERDPSPMLGIVLSTLELDKVEEDSLAGRMGLRSGDELVSLGGKEIESPMHLLYLMTADLRDLPPLVLRRDGQLVELDWQRRPASATAFFEGIGLKAGPRVAAVTSRSAAGRLGIMAGDVIVEIDGAEVKTYEDIRRFLKESSGENIEVAWERGGRRMEGSFEPVLIDIVPGVEEWMRKLGLAQACRVGVIKAWDFASQIYIIISKALSGQAGIMKNLGGPVTIARASYQIASRRSPTEFLLWLAIISVNLGVVNLLPIPLLDGGHLVVFTVEKLKGSPLSIRTQVVIQYIGLAFIGTLFLFVTYQDILRIFR